ncbi:tyrosine-type recombinase/integrase [Clostridium sp. LQ25]|uniref:site-specific tyrosine recombinase/integron integrase n=1 Tax=Clostridium sp. LQ25 TaxID=2992805 RepID=UPI0022597178|nr:site-specific tyrosine recombinase/integron integrase [Clostridium sp. LQ25]UZT06186.1 tyrosine-type recombinase/integrase [Clostridium sp. LQ25]
MKDKIIDNIQGKMIGIINEEQRLQLRKVLYECFCNIELKPKNIVVKENTENSLLIVFISAKRIEGCSEKTLKYYRDTINSMIESIDKEIIDITTEDLRQYLAEYQQNRKVSKVTLDNMRRIFSSFFAWLEDEDYIVKSPVRRIHKVKADKIIKEAFTDENVEILRDNCESLRDLAIVDILNSTGMRVGELVRLNRNDINFNDRQCIVFGKGSSEREVYFDAKTKIHLLNYLESRTDNNSALFVTAKKPNSRLTIGGVQFILRKLGKKANVNKVHPHRFRRTLATVAIDKGMPIEQVQRLLGHVKIDTTMHYAIVNQNNVKISHKKFIS